ncbi:hypothetical protein B0H10DRAFT_1939815 [Mycena sp. CBHHK59/15]|nr:hypothetical protein B0H10DRAFT_1939815 [Mycena sp. CBHHK59/15]
MPALPLLPTLHLRLARAVQAALCSPHPRFARSPTLSLLPTPHLRLARAVYATLRSPRRLPLAAPTPCPCCPRRTRASPTLSRPPSVRHTRASPALSLLPTPHLRLARAVYAALCSPRHPPLTTPPRARTSSAAHTAPMPGWAVHAALCLPPTHATAARLSPADLVAARTPQHDAAVLTTGQPQHRGWVPSLRTRHVQHADDARDLGSACTPQLHHAHAGK